MLHKTQTTSTLMPSAALPMAEVWSAKPGSLARLAQAIRDTLRAWRVALRQRQGERQMLSLDDRLLKDIGFTRTDVIWHAVRHRPDPDLRRRGEPMH